MAHAGPLRYCRSEGVVLVAVGRGRVGGEKKPGFPTVKIDVWGTLCVLGNALQQLDEGSRTGNEERTEFAVVLRRGVPLAHIVIFYSVALAAGLGTGLSRSPSKDGHNLAWHLGRL